MKETEGVAKLYKQSHKHDINETLSFFYTKIQSYASVILISPNIFYGFQIIWKWISLFQKRY